MKNLLLAGMICIISIAGCATGSHKLWQFPRHTFNFSEGAFGIKWGASSIPNDFLLPKEFPHIENWMLKSLNDEGGPGLPIDWAAGFDAKDRVIVQLDFLQHDESQSGFYRITQHLYDNVELHILLAELYSKYDKNVILRAEKDGLVYSANDGKVLIEVEYCPSKLSRIADLVVTWGPALEVEKKLIKDNGQNKK